MEDLRAQCYENGLQLCVLNLTALTHLILLNETKIMVVFSMFCSKFRLSVVKLSNGFVSRTNSVEIMASCVWSRLLNPDFVVDKLKKKTKGSCIRSNK